MSSDDRQKLVMVIWEKDNEITRLRMELGRERFRRERLLEVAAALSTLIEEQEKDGMELIE